MMTEKNFTMTQAKTKKEVDLTVRPLFRKIIMFSLPLILTGMLQLLYNAADIIVVGQFAGHTAMAAVGSTGALVNLVTNLFIGLSVGALAAAAKWVGAKNPDAADKVVHTAVTVSVIGGVAVGLFGFFASKWMLGLMSTPDSVLPLSTLYLKIFFVGMPFNLLYNFGASILRACGDTKRPLVILSLAGVVNIILNIVLVAGFRMSVAGVAIATTVSQLISAVLVVLVLMRREGYGRLSLKKLRIHKSALVDIVKIGLPAGIQSTIFSLSNVIIQSSINSFGDVAMAGNAAAANIESFVYVSMNSVSQACLTFTGQNYGAAKPKNIQLALLQCILFGTGVGLVLGISAYLASSALLYLYNTDPEVIRYGAQRMSVISTTYFLCGIMEILVGALRGIGHSVTPMIVSIVGVCGVRILWIYTLFAAERNLIMLYLSYPVSWLFTLLAHLVCYLIVRRKEFARLARMPSPDPPAA